VEIFDEFPCEKILPMITNDENFRFQFGEFLVQVGSIRLQTFKQSQKCVVCDREGVVFRLEKSLRKNHKKDDIPKRKIKWNEYWDTPHLNMYAIEYVPIKSGSNKRKREYILMTRDHIFPKSMGGKDSLDNSQTMCSRCNSVKGSKLDVKYIYQESIQEMLKDIPVEYPIQVYKPFVINY